MIHLLRAQPLPSADEAEPPKRLVILRWGENKACNDGKFIVNETTARELPRNQARVNFERVALDFNHNTVEGTPYYRGEPAPVAGYAALSVVPGEGLVYEDIEWTPEGIEHVFTKKHYRALSAAVKRNEHDEVIFCHSAAVCRQGQVPNLSILAADPLAALDKPDTTKTMEKALLLKLLGAILGREISGDISDEDLATAATEAAEKLSSPPAPAADAVATLTARIDAADAKIAAAEAKVEAAERRAIEAEALQQGKLIPLSAKTLGLEQYKTLVAELPKDQVPLGRRTPEGVASLASAPRTDPVEAEVRKNLGISEDAWKKHNG